MSWFGDFLDRIVMSFGYKVCGLLQKVSRPTSRSGVGV
jgi:hypothetical protein